MKTLLAIMLLAAAVRAGAQDSPTPLDQVKEGVYLRNIVGSVTILELKAGQFRYWTANSNQVDGLATGFQIGTYATDGGTLRFAVKTSVSPRQMFELMGVEYRGRTILWTANAQQNWEETQKQRRTPLADIPPVFGMFYLTNSEPEKLLEDQIAVVARRAASQPSRVPESAEPLGHVPEGIFFNDFTSTSREKIRRLVYANVLELKDSEFRFWQARGSNKTQEAWSTLESGRYATNGGTVTFVARRNPKDKPITNEWIFMKFRGQTSVWHKTALDDWKKRGSINMAGVHFLTIRKPEDILEGK